MGRLRVVQSDPAADKCPSGIHCSSDRHLLPVCRDVRRRFNARAAFTALPTPSSIMVESYIRRRFNARAAFTALPTSSRVQLNTIPDTFQCPRGIHCSSDPAMAAAS